MAWDDEDSRYSGRRNTSAASPIASIDTDETQARVENILHGGGLNSALQVHTNKDGKASWLFFKNLPPEVAGLLEYGYTTIKPFIGRHGAEFLYDKTSDTLKWLRPQTTEITKHKAGLNASKIFMAALIAADPIQRLIGVRSQYNEEKKQLFQSIAPVIEADKDAYKHNEIISAALARMHDDVSTGLKEVAAELPIIGLTSWFAARDYDRIKKTKHQEFETRKQFVKPEHDFHAEVNNTWMEREARIDASVADLQKKYRSEGRDQSYINKKIDEYERQARLRYEQKDEIKENLDQRHNDDSAHGRDSTTAKMAVAGAATMLIKSRIGHNAEKILAMDLIRQLASDVENESSVSGLKERIVEIFQQNERDHKRPAIGSRLLPQLEPAINEIAQAISNHTLNPLALISLAGGKRKVIAQQNGKRTFATKEQTLALIGEQRRILNSPERITAEEFFSDHVDPVFIKNMLKQTFDALPEEEKAALSALFPADVIIQVGYKKERVAELQAKGHDRLYPFVTSRALELAEKSADELKKLNLNDQDIEILHDLADKILSGDKQAVQIEVDGKEKSGLDVIRRATLAEQSTHKEGAGFWTRMFERARSVPEIIAERRKQREQEEPSSAGRMAAMNKNTGTPVAGEGTFSESEEAPSLSAREREESRRRDAGTEAQEIGA